jgi:hypothetical protein
MSTANTKECILYFKGCKVIGVLQDRLPMGRLDLSRGTTTILFDNGMGLTFKGTYWPESKEDIAYAKKELWLRADRQSALAARISQAHAMSTYAKTDQCPRCKLEGVIDGKP